MKAPGSRRNWLWLVAGCVASTLLWWYWKDIWLGESFRAASLWFWTFAGLGTLFLCGYQFATPTLPPWVRMVGVVAATISAGVFLVPLVWFALGFYWGGWWWIGPSSIMVFVAGIALREQLRLGDGHIRWGTFAAGMIAEILLVAVLVDWAFVA